MGGDNKEPKLTYALDSSGKMVHISSVERGLSCNCRCPKCNEFLVAKLGHEGGRQPHFAHHKGSDCHGSYMSALHKLAEQIIEEEKAVMANNAETVASRRHINETSGLLVIVIIILRVCRCKLEKLYYFAALLSTWRKEAIQAKQCQDRKCRSDGTRSDAID